MEQNECKRCGTCCTKGGPSLHKVDIDLVLSGQIPIEALMTLRIGEPAFNPKTQRLIRLPTELIKIKGKKQGWECVFYNGKERACSIYPFRPLECRVLKCWDTTEITRLFLKDTLSRKDILLHILPEMKDLIEVYDKTFPPQQIFILGVSRKEAARQDIERMIALDIKFRQKVTKAMGIDNRHLEFFFGRDVKTLLNALIVHTDKTEKAGKRLHQ